MLRDDPIVLQYPDFLPTEDEVDLAWNILQEPACEAKLSALTQHIAIGGDARATLRRFCWQAREEHKLGEDCAKGAIEWLERCMASRQKLGIDSILGAGPFTAAFHDLYFRTIPLSFHGVDKLGHPVHIVRYGLVDVKALQELWEAGQQLQESADLPVNGAVLFHLRAMEYAMRVLMGRESERQGRVVDRMLVIMDMGGIGMRHVDPLLRNFLKPVSGESLSLYPETLHATIIANAPWLVARAAWPLAKKFVHPVTQAKITVLGAGQALTNKLLEFIDVSNIPPYFGGHCECVECSNGHLSGGSLRTWEEEMGLFV